MRRILKLALGSFVAVLLWVAGIWIYALAANGSNWLADLNHRLNPPHYAVVYGDQIYFSDVNVHGKPLNEDGYFATEIPVEHEDYNWVNVWIFMLDGFEAIEQYQLAENLGINVENVSNTASHLVVKIERSGVAFRWSILPFYPTLRRIVILNDNDLMSNYPKECIRDVVFHYASGAHGAFGSPDCKRNDEE